jgi:hypothetical protein
MAAARANLLETDEAPRDAASQKLVPGLGPESNDAGKPCFNVPKLNGAHQPGKVRAKKDRRQPESA